MQPGYRKLGFVLTFPLILATAAVLAQASPAPLSLPGALEAGVAQSGQILEAETLLERARERGSVMVIVRLSLPEPFLGEGQLAAADRGRQRAQIGFAARALEQDLRSLNAEVYRRYETIPALAMRVDAAALDALRRSPLIEHLQEDEAVPVALGTSTGVIGAPAVWGQGLTGTGQAVVILDTGIDGDHAFFTDSANESRIVAAACFSNAGGAGGKVSLCPNGQPTQVGTGAAEAKISACVSGGNQLCNHGSHVAGIAAGRGASFQGVAPDAGIIPIQVFTRFNSSIDCFPSTAPCVLSYTSDQLAALNHVFNVLHPDHPVAAVNMSLGGGSNTTYCDSDVRKPAVDNLRSVGIATAIATGNNGWTDAISTPSCISSAIAVSSTTNADAVSSFSNVHPIMDLFAPGSGITSAIVGGGYASFSGTSMAAPHVAGAWALLRQTAPGAGVEQILEALIDTGVMVTDNRSGGTVTKPRIQLDAAEALIALNTWNGISNDWNDPGNWSRGSLPTCQQDVVIPASAATQPLLSADSEARNLTIEPGAGLAIGTYTLRLCGDLDVQTDGTLSGIGGTLHFDGTGTAAITMPEGSRQIHHLRVGNGIDPMTLVMSNPLRIAGNLTVEAQATLHSNGHELLFNGGGQAFNLMEPLAFTYTNGFDSLAGWTVFDANSDGVTWYATSSSNQPNNPHSGQHVRYRGNANLTTAANDWLFSPGIALQAGVPYSVRFNYGARNASFPERMRVWIGNTNSVAAMTTQLFDNGNITNTSWTEGEGTFTPPVTGIYHVGFHAYSQANRRELAVDDLRVEGGGTHTFHQFRIAPNTALTLNSEAGVRILGNLAVEGILNLNGTSLSVDGTVTNTGRLRDTREVPGNPATTEFLHIRNQAGDASRYRGVDITPTGTGLGATSVEIRGHANCTQNTADPLFRRCFDITPENADSANLRFWLSDAERNDQNASTTRVFRWHGTAWTEPSASYQRSSAGAACNSVDSDQCWVQTNGVADYSPFVLGSGGTPTGSPDSPTAVVMGNVELLEADVSQFLRGLGADALEADRLLSLLRIWDPSTAAALEGSGRNAILEAIRAYLDPDGDGRVAVLRWQTLEERGTIGFRVQRRQGDGWQTIHTGMLPAMVAAPMGAEYMLADPGAQPGEIYEYRLIEIEAWGSTREYGPYPVRMGDFRPE